MKLRYLLAFAFLFCASRLLCQTVATPTFAVTAGSYSTPQLVALADSTPSSTIYYTVDGSTPTTSSAVYLGNPIYVFYTQTLKALGTAPGFTNSSVGSASYAIAQQFTRFSMSRVSPSQVTVPAPRDDRPLPSSGVRLFEIEPSKGTFNWTKYDQWVASAAAGGWNLNFTYEARPQWMSGQPYATQEGPSSDWNTATACPAVGGITLGTTPDCNWKTLVIRHMMHVTGLSVVPSSPVSCPHLNAVEAGNEVDTASGSSPTNGNAMVGWNGTQASFVATSNDAARIIHQWCSVSTTHMLLGSISAVVGSSTYTDAHYDVWEKSALALVGAANANLYQGVSIHVYPGRDNVYDEPLPTSTKSFNSAVCPGASNNSCYVAPAQQVTRLQSVALGQTSTVSWSKYLPVDTTEDGFNMIKNLNIGTPVNSAFTTATTGGTLVPGTYFYRVAALGSTGTTLASTETSKVVPAGTNTNTVTVKWGAVSSTGYKVYGRSTGAELLMATLGNVTSWVDDGSVAPSGALPAANTTSPNQFGIAYMSEWPAVVAAQGAKTAMMYLATDFPCGVSNWGCYEFSSAGVHSPWYQAFAATVAWEASATAVFPGTASSITGGTMWTYPLTISGGPAAIVWCEVPIGSTCTTGTSFTTQKNIAGAVTATGGSLTLSSTSELVYGVSSGGTTYYIAPASASPPGNDSNAGTSPSVPWLSPSHALNCGDVILAAAGNYDSANFWNDKWGHVNCPAKNNVAWLKCATFDTCKISSTARADMFVSASFWGVQGWEFTTPSGGNTCVNVAPDYYTTVQIDHIIIANNVVNRCDGDGIGTGNGYGSSVGTDYVAFLGNIAYDTGHTFCAAGMSFWAGVASDTAAGTHYYMAGNFAWNNHSTCGDAEGLIIDTMDGVEAGYTPIPYAQQIVATNNLSIWNDGPGLQVDLNMNGTPNVHAPVFMTHNTMVNNNVGTSTASYCAQLVVGTTVNTVTGGNLSATYQHYCFGGSSVLSYAEAAVYAPSSTNIIAGDYAYSSYGNSVGLIASSGVVVGTNISTPDPAFSNPVDPSAPSCGSASSVPNCMAPVIANFKPTASAALTYGYQIPSNTPVVDPYYPQWLCGVTNMPSGLVTPGCGSALSGRKRKATMF